MVENANMRKALNDYEKRVPSTIFYGVTTNIEKELKEVIKRLNGLLDLIWLKKEKEKGDIKCYTMGRW